MVTNSILFMMLMTTALFESSSALGIKMIRHATHSKAFVKFCATVNSSNPIIIKLSSWDTYCLDIFFTKYWHCSPNGRLNFFQGPIWAQRGSS